MRCGKIRSGKITGPVQNCPALSMVFGAFEVFKSTESEADPINCIRPSNILKLGVYSQFVGFPEPIENIESDVSCQNAYRQAR